MHTSRTYNKCKAVIIAGREHAVHTGSLPYILRQKERENERADGVDMNEFWIRVGRILKS